MELTDRFTVRASAARTWEVIWDLPRLAKLVPGCEEIQTIDDKTFKAKVSQKVGPFKVTLDLDLAVQEVEPGKMVSVSGTGKDRAGNRLTLNKMELVLDGVSEQETAVSYIIDFNLYGRLATLGAAVVKRKAEEIRVEFTQRLTADLEGAAG